MPTVIEVDTDPETLRKAREDPKTRTIYHVTVHAHPDQPVTGADDIVFERYLEFDMVHAVNRVLVITDDEIGLRKLLPPGTWGPVDCYETAVGGTDGAEISDEDYYAILTELNAQVTERRAKEREIAEGLKGLADRGRGWAGASFAS